MCPGGEDRALDLCMPLLKKVAARDAKGKACVGRCGMGGSGHVGFNFSFWIPLRFAIYSSGCAIIPLESLFVEVSADSAVAVCQDDPQWYRARNDERAVGGLADYEFVSWDEL